MIVWIYLLCITESSIKKLGKLSLKLNQFLFLWNKSIFEQLTVKKNITCSLDNLKLKI